jgi:hypothetical protein
MIHLYLYHFRSHHNYYIIIIIIIIIVVVVVEPHLDFIHCMTQTHNSYKSYILETGSVSVPREACPAGLIRYLLMKISFV